MSKERNYVMTIAGFDPSGGAGILADAKTFEQHHVQGLCVNTSNTLQTATKFYSSQWLDLKDVLNAIDILLAEYPVKVVKTSIVPSFDFLLEVIQHLKNKNESIKIIVDPVIRSSTGFNFQTDIKRKDLINILKNIFLITPNIHEAMQLSNNTDSRKAAAELAEYCNVLLKGGHDIKEPGFDYLYMDAVCHVLKPSGIKASEKHGSGCVLSAAICSNLALGLDLKAACIEAKKYVEQFLSSNKTLLGYHSS